MLRFLFDTDHLTLFEVHHPPIIQRLAMQPTGSVGISAVTVEESLRGRLATLARARDSQKRINQYAQLLATIRVFSQLPLVPFDSACESQYQRLLLLRLRVGTQDLKIAAVALTNNLTLLTRNRVDFSRIPGLFFDDWSV